MTEKIISFVIPCKNASSSIAQCIDAIKNQSSSQNLEIIVVDNLSTDNSLSIAKELAHKVLIEQLPKVSRVRNKGARNASGEFIAFIDADTIIPKFWLSKALKHFSNPKIIAVGSKTHKVPSEASWISKIWKMHCDAVNSKDGLPIRAIIVRTATFNKTGGFDESLTACSNISLCPRFLSEGEIINDQDIIPTHLGNPLTLMEFLQKEAWKSADDIKNSIKHIIKTKNPLSKKTSTIILPFYYALLISISLPSFILFLYGKFMIIFPCVLISLVVPIFLTPFNTCKKNNRWNSFFQLLIIYLAHILGRVKALFSWKDT